jgi:hypothetical protein
MTTLTDKFRLLQFAQLDQEQAKFGLIPALASAALMHGTVIVGDRRHGVRFVYHEGGRIVEYTAEQDRQLGIRRDEIWATRRSKA